MKIRSALRFLAAVALGLGGASLAQAGPIVTDWSYSVSGAWTNWAPAGVTHNGNTLQWGTSTGFGQSSLTIGNNPATGSVDTFIGGGNPPAAYVAAALTLTHQNNPITGTSLTLAQLTATLQLTPTTPPGPLQNLPSLAYDIKFVETPNQTPCAAPSPAGNPCNDIFVQVTGLLNQTFVYDGNTYFVNVFPTAGNVLSVLPNSACAAAGVANGCIGFTTVERQSTLLPFGFTISTLPLSVPEPGIMALLGLGLGAAGFIGRRRKVA